MPEADQSNIASVVEYVVISPKIGLFASASADPYRVFQLDIMLQAQGEAIELPDVMSPKIAAFAFAAVYDISREAVFCLPDGKRVLLFDHQKTEPLRPKDIDVSLWEEIKIVKNQAIVRDAMESIPENTIDLSEVWARVSNTDFLEHSKLFIKTLAKGLQPSSKLHLKGEIPSLALLAAIYVARPYGKVIDYMDSKGESVILFL